MSRRFFLGFALCALFGAIYFAYREVTPPYASEVVRISKTKVSSMNAEDFLRIVKSHRMIFVTPSGNHQGTMERYILDWPRETDIPYLLKSLSNQEQCGILGDVWSSYSYPRYKTYSEVRFMALHLLKSVKEKAFYHYPLQSPISWEEQQDIINWAKDQI